MNMKSHRNVDKMSLTSKNSDEQERWKEEKRMLLAIHWCRYLTEVCQLRMTIKESSHTQYQNTYCMYLQPIAS